MEGSMIAVKIDIKAQKVVDRFGRMLRRLPKISEEIAKEIAEEYAESLRNVAKTAFTFPTGKLYKSIKVKRIKASPNEYTYGVAMVRYAMFVDRGRRKGKAPPNIAKIRAWAEKAGFSSWWLRTTIARHGTRPRKFIYPASVRARQNIKRILSEKAKKLVR